MTLRRAVTAFTILLTVGRMVPPLHAADPTPRRGFGLFTRLLGAITVNRVYCGLTNAGEICVDSTNSTTVGGGYWPRGTRNQYVFNSGPQMAGIIGSDGGPWAGDTTGAFFFDARGDQAHGEGIAGIYNARSPGDAAAWPVEGRVPSGPGSLFQPVSQGAVSASEGDLWWLMWEGDPSRLNGREHPLGVAAEMRVLGWNYPVGNEDLVYFVLTYYNITSLDPADYAGVRPELRPVLLDLAARFHALNDAQFQITLPAGGYTIDSLFTDFAADEDVGDAGVNYASVNIPFSLGFAWEHSFSAFAGWTFDPAVFSTPFFAGTGFAGIAFLELPSGAGRLHLFSNLAGGGGDPGDPRGVGQLYRFISGTLSPIYGDAGCSFVPLTDHICFIRATSPTDIRFLQSTGPYVLAPGQAQSQVVAYVFAAPVGPNPNCLNSPSCVTPGNFNIIKGMSNPAVISAGVNKIDSITGFLGASDLSGDGILQKDEFITVPRSLLAKTQLAQALLDNQFLLPTAPAPPDFFLIPGDNQVSVIWRPSATEQTGEPFFNIAKDPQVMNAQGVLVGNPLYDPNFRQFDVEGYRVYRGRVDDPGALTVVASFDYAGTVISDYSGQVNPTRLCAPELGITTDCPVAFEPIQPGVGRTVHVDIPLVGEVVQVRQGDRIPLTDGSALVLRADTSFAQSGDPSCLCDTGVPFVFVDNGVRSNFRYFYSVTAFDVNSVESGPASMESPRILKSVTPVRPASNFENTAVVTQTVYGRGVARTDSLLPVLDPATGIFSKPMPATDGWQLQLISFVKEVIGRTDSIVIRLDSMVLGSAYDGIANQYWATATTAAGSTELSIPIVQPADYFPAHFTQSFNAIPLDPDLAARFGGNGTFTLSAQFDAALAGNYYTSAFGRGCLNKAVGNGTLFNGGAGCDYNGARWFDGPSPNRNESAPNPNACSTDVNTLNYVTCYANAGSLTGVVIVHEVKSYVTTSNVWRAVEGVLGGATRGADYNVYWGTAGAVDSVVDVSNNVVVPFAADLRSGASWGILNQGATTAPGSYDQRAELTVTDFGCVEPLKSFPSITLLLPCAAAAPYQLSQTAIPGPIVFWSGPTSNAQNGCTVGVGGCGTVAANPGFAMYLPGHIFLFELENGQVPGDGTVWSMRDYIGAIRGGGDNCPQCTAGSDGPYVFSGFSPRTFAAVSAELRFRYDVTNRLSAPTGDDLSQVHTVPDPYYLKNDFEADAGQQVIKFVNLPADAIVRVYSSSGVLVTLLEHHSQTFGGSEDWDVRNRTRRRVASGVYFYHIEAGAARRVGRLTIINDRPGF